MKNKNSFITFFKRYWFWNTLSLVCLTGVYFTASIWVSILLTMVVVEHFLLNYVLFRFKRMFDAFMNPTTIFDQLFKDVPRKEVNPNGAERKPDAEPNN